MSGNEIEEQILRALRRITRAIDLHSRKLANTFGLTGPQLVCLRALAGVENTTPSKLAKEVSLSQATVTGIIDRLVARQLVTRDRSSVDRRLVTVTITSAGRALVEQAPSPLQQRFIRALGNLELGDQERIRETLELIGKMMGVEELKAAPVLTTSPAAQSAEEIHAVMEAGDLDVALVADVARGIDALATAGDMSDAEE